MPQQDKEACIHSNKWASSATPPPFSFISFTSVYCSAPCVRNNKRSASKTPTSTLEYPKHWSPRYIFISCYTSSASISLHRHTSFMEQVKGFLNEESLARKFLGRSKPFRANLLEKILTVGEIPCWRLFRMEVPQHASIPEQMALEIMISLPHSK